MFTLYSADFIGNPGNCSYPHKTVVMDADSIRPIRKSSCRGLL